MSGPIERPRRLRASTGLRSLVREQRLAGAQLVQPLFVKEGLTHAVPIPSMPGVAQHDESSFRAAVRRAQDAGVGALMVFAIPLQRDPSGSAAYSADGILARSVRWAREETAGALPVIADPCLDEFTSHGHCGLLAPDGTVDNDATLEAYGRMAIVLANAGADILGLSGMMDGQVAAVRAALDRAGHEQVVLLAYAAKFASAFYGPFRDAVDSCLAGDRRTYQQDPANRREAAREVRLDIAEGADIVMVKPALGYLDIVADTAAAVDVPVAAYVVSGEFAMIEAAAAAGMIDREAAILEALSCVHRAGARIIATYWATEVGGWLRSGRS